ncbi:L-idonate 5-dehydrogenase [Pacificibacter marinus]|uniref:L-idonate 5-dehydrogenase (NAD(P)(+)) n=1 Tax=Pacificibacter marinus TaxID=658057 RepID=A0A1Y5S7L2_9RHOB|nr:L-idonate 5-dehydrogenase [Pacificibacter marinus]SEK77097.1 L-idonate 5-dehydrogenase [Pacificibacter marinus]SLN34271.1 L-idonate 5-dehydrogenase (NAD(P)(+)) [Pacificibacter marinus]
MKTRVCCLHSAKDLRVETREVAPPKAGEVRVAVGAGGICGSDLHYYQHGGFGAIRVTQPIILGHEAAGFVKELGEGVTGLKVGDMVALNPSIHCGTCEYCVQGLEMHCTDMIFSGSAMRTPHVQGLYRDQIVLNARQCVPMSGDVSVSEAACSEPLAVCMHARSLAGDLSGKRVLVAGAGPIGVLCAALAKEAGAAQIVVTDLQDMPLSVAREMGATSTINVLTDGDALAAFAQGKGHFDVVFECTGAAPAIAAALAALRPRGVMVQVGMAGDTAVPLSVLVAKEITHRGTFRFHKEFAQAATAISERRIDVRPMISAQMPLDQADAAFELAADRTRAVKVHFVFND